MSSQQRTSNTTVKWLRVTLRSPGIFNNEVSLHGGHNIKYVSERQICKSSKCLKCQQNDDDPRKQIYTRHKNNKKELSEIFNLDACIDPYRSHV